MHKQVENLIRFQHLEGAALFTVQPFSFQTLQHLNQLSTTVLTLIHTKVTLKCFCSAENIFFKFDVKGF